MKSHAKGESLFTFVNLTQGAGKASKHISKYVLSASAIKYPKLFFI